MSDLLEYSDASVFVASNITANFAGGDILTMLSSALSRVQVLGVSMNQIPPSTAPLTHPMSVEIFRGSTSVGAGGATLTPVNHSGHTGAKSAVTSVLGPPSAGNSTATGSERVLAGGFDATGGTFSWEPRDSPLTLGINDMMFVRTSTSLISTAGVTMAITVRFRELGKMPL